MTPESFHFLLDQDPKALISITAGIVIMFTLMIVAVWRRWHPIVLWFAFSGLFFGFSQTFPENRDKKLMHLVGAAVAGAILTIFWAWRVAPGLREKLKKR